MPKQVYETIDYCIFEKEILSFLKKRDFEHSLSFISSFHMEKNIFNLWGEAGSGKTTYVELIQERLNKNFIKINQLEDIVGEHKIFIWDAINECNVTPLEILKKVRNTGNKIIISGWEKIEGVIHPEEELKYRKEKDRWGNWLINRKISPSEECLPSVWKEILSKFKVGDFSIREKTLMCNVFNVKKIVKKRPKELMWKAFENIFLEFSSNKKERREIKESYKKLINENAIFASKKVVSDNHFQWFRDKALIQYNGEKGKFIYSHPHIVLYIYLRNRREEIKKLSFSKKDIKMLLTFPEIILWYFQDYYKRSEDYDQKEQELLNFFADNKFLFSVQSLEQIGKNNRNLFVSKLFYKPLKAKDLIYLEQNNYIDVLYSEYLKENIREREVDFLDINSTYSELCLFIIAIVTSSVHSSNICSYFNRMNILGNWNSIKWDNSTPRKKMLNYLLLRYINVYTGENVNPLITSNLQFHLFAFKSPDNVLDFKKFLKKIWDRYEGGEFDSIIYLFENSLNYSSARSYLLENSSRFSNIDSFFKCKRNVVTKKDFSTHAHQVLFFHFYRIFEHCVNPWEIEEGKRTLERDSLGVPIDPEYNLTTPFLKFLHSISNYGDEYSINDWEPIEIFDNNIPMPLDSIFDWAIQDNGRFMVEITKYIKSLNDSGLELMSLEWGDRYTKEYWNKGVFITPFNTTSLFDPDVSEDSFIQDYVNVYKIRNNNYYNFIQDDSRIRVTRRTSSFNNLYYIQIKFDTKNEKYDKCYCLNLQDGNFSTSEHRDGKSRNDNNEDFYKREETYAKKRLPILERMIKKG